ncbi:MAG: hypothetical protein ACYCOU_08510 [Sulfobacillus sp.]
MIRRVISFDVESDSLHGEGFAVGAVEVDLETKQVLDKFEGRTEAGQVCPYVKEVVLPAVSSIPIGYPSPKELRSAFWEWMRGKLSATTASAVVVDCGWPVEARFLAACVDDDRETRYWQGPYPLHEVATALLSAGVDPDVDREALVCEYLRGKVPRKHHPTWDAEISALCFCVASEIAKGRKNDQTAANGE